jgi:hypothetical protein
VIPFVLACVILACNQATGVNSIIGYNANILLQSGLSDVAGSLGLCSFHHREFPDDHWRHRAGGSQGTQIPAIPRQRRHYRVASLHRDAFPSY